MSSSASRSLLHSSADPTSCSWTSPPPGSTPRDASQSEGSSRHFATAAWGCCSRPTSSPKPNASPTALIILAAGQERRRGHARDSSRSSPALRESSSRRRSGSTAGRSPTHSGFPQTSVTEPEPGSYRVEAEGSPARVAALTAWLAGRDITVRNLRTGGGDFEDVYMSLVSRGAGAPTSEAMLRRVRARRPRAELSMTLRRGESLLLTIGIPVLLLAFFSSVHLLPTGTPHPVAFPRTRACSPSR